MTKGSSRGGFPRKGRPPAKKRGKEETPENRLRRTWAGPRWVGERVGESSRPARELEGELRGFRDLRPEREREGIFANEPGALDAIEADLWEDLGHRLEAESRESGNPLYAWKGFALAREFGRPVPEWVSAYLDGCAESLLSLAASPPAKVPPAVARALGLRVSRGRGSDFAAFAAFRRHVSIANTVRLLREGGATWEQAFALAGERHGVSESTARDAWRELRALLPRRASFWARRPRDRGPE